MPLKNMVRPSKKGQTARAEMGKKPKRKARQGTRVTKQRQQ